ncbi:MAG: hypothetical protein WBK28_03405 [Minisyncoccia bacterium]
MTHFSKAHRAQIQAAEEKLLRAYADVAPFYVQNGPPKKGSEAAKLLADAWEALSELVDAYALPPKRGTKRVQRLIPAKKAKRLLIAITTAFGWGMALGFSPKTFLTTVRPVLWKEG